MVEERLGKEVIADSSELVGVIATEMIGEARRGDDASRLAREDAVNRGKRGVELAADCQIIDNIAKPTRSCGRCPRGDRCQSGNETASADYVDRALVRGARTTPRDRTLHTRSFQLSIRPTTAYLHHPSARIHAHHHHHSSPLGEQRVIRYLTVSLRARYNARQASIETLSACGQTVSGGARYDYARFPTIISPASDMITHTHPSCPMDECKLMGVSPIPRIITIPRICIRGRLTFSPMPSPMCVLLQSVDNVARNADK